MLVSTPAQERPRHSIHLWQLVSTPTQEQRSALYRCVATGKHTSSRAPAPRCTCVWQLASAQALYLGVAAVKHRCSRAPAQQCLHVWQLVSAPAQEHPLSTACMLVSAPAQERPVSTCGNWQASAPVLHLCVTVCGNCA